MQETTKVTLVFLECPCAFTPASVCDTTACECKVFQASTPSCKILAFPIAFSEYVRQPLLQVTDHEEAARLSEDYLVV